MKINTINLSFNKRLVANCYIKNSQKEKHSASLYEYNPKDAQDIKEIENSDSTNSIKYDFYKAGFWCNHSPARFYALKDNQTDEIVSSAELTYHYTADGKKSGYYISIDEIEDNKDYIDSLAPIIAYISNEAYMIDAKNIQTSFREYEAPNLSAYKFKKTPLDNLTMSKSRFDENILKAEKRNNIEFLA